MTPEQFCDLQGWGRSPEHLAAAEQLLAAMPDLAARQVIATGAGIEPVPYPDLPHDAEEPDQDATIARMAAPEQPPEYIVDGLVAASPEMEPLGRDRRPGEDDVTTDYGALRLAALAVLDAIDNDEEGNDLGGYDHLAAELAALRRALDGDGAETGHHPAPGYGLRDAPDRTPRDNEHGAGGRDRQP